MNSGFSIARASFFGLFVLISACSLYVIYSFEVVRKLLLLFLMVIMGG